jgi:nicotinamide-nucleotide adenylyltransferase
MMKTFDAARHRSQLHANPLSFFERQTLIHSVLTDEGISPEQFTIIPFPIERDEILTEYFPIPGRCLTTLHSEWNEVKIKILERVGYSVEVIADPDRFAKRRTSGSNIRAAIRAGDDSWLDYVPSKTAELIRGKLWSRFEM